MIPVPQVTGGTLLAAQTAPALERQPVPDRQPVADRQQPLPGRIFAAPTYLFVTMMYVLIGVGDSKPT